MLIGSFIVVFLVLFWLVAKILKLIPEPIGPNAQLFADGARVTLLLTITSGLIGTIFGLIASIAKLSKNPLFNLPANFYIWVIRGTPLIVQIFFVFYGLPVIMPSLQLDEFWSSVLALSLNVGAYNAEVFRAGILAIPNGQREAARSLGLSSWQTLIYIVIPQALRISIPPLVNNIVALLKDSSLAFVTGLVELTLTGDRIRAETFQPIPVLMTVAAVYLCLTTVITLFSGIIEKKMSTNNRNGKNA